MIHWFFKVIMPAITIITLIWFTNGRDPLVRLFIAIYFSLAYWSVAILYEKKVLFSIMKWNKGISQLIQILLGAVIVGYGMFVLTQLTIYSYLSSISNLAFPIAFINGMIFAVYFGGQYFILPDKEE